MNVGRASHVVWSVVVTELALYLCLVRWLTRRPDVPPGATAVGYSALVGPMLWLWIFGSTTEVIVVEVVLRSLNASWADAIRWPLLVIGVWSVLWMLGMLASYRVRPHLLLADTIRVRNGPRAWVDVPRGAVRAIKRGNHQLPGVIRAVHVEDNLLLIGVSSATNVVLDLDRPHDLTASTGPQPGIEHVGLWVDDPAVLSELLKHRP